MQRTQTRKKFPSLTGQLLSCDSHAGSQEGPVLELAHVAGAKIREIKEL